MSEKHRDTNKYQSSTTGSWLQDSIKDCDFFYRMQWVVWMSMILFRWCDCNVFLCVMLHMNRFHTHSVRLRCVMCNWDVRFQITYICIYAHTNCNHTMWTKTKSHSQNIVPCERVELQEFGTFVPSEGRLFLLLLVLQPQQHIAIGVSHTELLHTSQWSCIWKEGPAVESSTKLNKPHPQTLPMSLHH